MSEKYEQLSLLKDKLYKKENGEYLDGYVTITKIDNDGGAKNTPVKAEDFDSALSKYIGEKNVYYGPNTTYNGKRNVNNIRQLVSLYVDFDNKGRLTALEKKRKKKEICEKVSYHASIDLVPIPSLLVDSGNGIHAYWTIKDMPYQSMWMWQAVEDYFIHALKEVDLPVDSSVKDVARLLRCPSTKNDKSECNIIFSTDNKYILGELYDKYIPKKARGRKYNVTNFLDAKKNKKHLPAKNNIPTKENPVALKDLKINTKHINIYRSKEETIKSIDGRFNSYTLHQARINDITTLCILREWNMTGYRNKIMHCYVYWIGIIIRTESDLLDTALDFNSRFKEPMKKYQIKSIVKSALKAVRKFVQFENDRLLGVDRRVSKKMRDKPGYWYKNETLIDMYDVTSKEEESMITIISKKEKYNRNNKRRREKYRNEEGLTKTEVRRRNEFIVIARLSLNNQSLRSISKMLNKAPKTIREKINKEYNIINYNEIYEEIKSGLYKDISTDYLLKTIISDIS